MADETPTSDAPENGSPAPQPAPVQPAPSQDEALGDGGKKALAEERASRREAEKRLKDMQVKLDRLDELERQNMTEQEKAVAQARAEARQEAMVSSSQRLVRAEVRAAAAGKLADPDDAAFLIGDLAGYVDGDGEVNTKAIAKAIDALVNAKPYLGVRQEPSKPAALPGGGAMPSNGTSMDDFIRHQAGGRR